MPFHADHERARVHEHPEGTHADVATAWAAVRAHWEARRDAFKKSIVEGGTRLRHHERRRLSHAQKLAEIALATAHKRSKEPATPWPAPRPGG